jgi:hypothetical protein
MPPEFLGARELAEELQMPYGDVLSLSRRGRIPYTKAGGQYFYVLSRVVRALRRKPETIPAPESEATPAS